MNRLKQILFSILVFSLLGGAIYPAFGASLDFAWGAPFPLAEKSDRREGKRYLAWPLQVSNRTGKRWFSELDVVAVTDTGRQYAPVSGLKIHAAAGFQNILAVQRTIFPAVTQRAIALFEDIDPKANRIDFYVGGLVETKKRERDQMKYLRITYKRSASGWVWEGTHVLE